MKVFVSVMRVRLLAPLLAALCMFLLASGAVRAGIEQFAGTYVGAAEVVDSDGGRQMRDLSVEITLEKKGFTVAWTSTTVKPDGREKTKSYEINFVPTDRADVFSAAMRRNVFGHEVPLDPMKGEPYVWARFTGDTLTVYSLHVDDDGGYELQQFDRTLIDEGLALEFRAMRDGMIRRTVSTVLQRTTD